MRIRSITKWLATRKWWWRRVTLPCKSWGSLERIPLPWIYHPFLVLCITWMILYISDHQHLLPKGYYVLTVQVSGESPNVKSCSQDQDIHLCLMTILIHQCSSFHLVNAGSNNGDVGFGTGFQEILWFGDTLTTNVIIYEEKYVSQLWRKMDGMYICTRCENRDKIRTACTSETPSKDLFHKSSDPPRYKGIGVTKDDIVDFMLWHTSSRWVCESLFQHYWIIMVPEDRGNCDKSG